MSEVQAVPHNEVKFQRSTWIRIVRRDDGQPPPHTRVVTAVQVIKDDAVIAELPADSIQIEHPVAGLSHLLIGTAHFEEVVE